MIIYCHLLKQTIWFQLSLPSLAGIRTRDPDHDPEMYKRGYDPAIIPFFFFVDGSNQKIVEKEKLKIEFIKKSKFPKNLSYFTIRPSGFGSRTRLDARVNFSVMIFAFFSCAFGIDTNAQKNLDNPVLSNGRQIFSAFACQNWIMSGFVNLFIHFPSILMVRFHDLFVLCCKIFIKS